MAVPAHVAADLVLVQAALVLGRLEALLDGPPRTGYPNQLGDGRVRLGKGEVASDPLGVGQAATGQYPAIVRACLAVRMVVSGEFGCGPVVDPRPFAPSRTRSAPKRRPGHRSGHGQCASSPQVT